jgi:hypothetical protein
MEKNIIKKIQIILKNNLSYSNIILSFDFASLQSGRIALYLPQPADPADRLTAVCLFFLFHAGFQSLKPKKIKHIKMFKKLLFFSLIMASSADFRFGGVSFIVIPNLAKWPENQIWQTFFQLKSTTNMVSLQL